MTPTDPARMHRYDEGAAALARAVFDYVSDRTQREVPLDGPRSAAELEAEVGGSVTADGLGWEEALRRFTDVLAKATISMDHPLHLAYVPAAPTEAAVLFDLVVSASSIFGGSWQEGAGAVFAENQALDWLAGLCDLPEGAGGCFVSGGSAANLSALVAARHAAAAARGGRPARWRIAATAEAHSSVRSAMEIMDVGVLEVPGDHRGALRGDALRDALDADPEGGDGLFAVVATAGSTNVGVVDDLAGAAAVAGEHGLWLHVDAAYGGAGLAAPTVRPLFDGIERADSVTIDPHKWLFSPFDCAALLYRDPALAAAAHTQEAAYLDAVTPRRVEPPRLRLPPLPAGPGPALLVLARGPRQRRLPRRRGGEPHPRPPGGGGDLGSGRLRAGHRARAVRGAVPAPRVDAGRLRPLGGRAAGRAAGLRPGDLVAGRAGDALLLRQPADDGGDGAAAARLDARLSSASTPSTAAITSSASAVER